MWSTIHDLLRKLVPKDVRRRVRIRLGHVDFQDRLENLRDCGFSPQLIVDVGAYKTSWARMAKRIFPQSSLLLIEPQPHLTTGLIDFCTEFSDSVWENSALGGDEGELSFQIQGSNSRIITENHWLEGGEEIVTVPCLSLATILRKHKLVTPDLLKIDAQGHELKILESMTDLLGQIDVIVCELSIARIGPVPLALEVIAFLGSNGFELYDIVGQNYLPKSKALWQIDAFFVRRESSLIPSNPWLE